ncbi:RNA polymerase sigma factor [Gimesia panareensis]|uniref:RNA polymerase sigma factor n=1 Tax=Gimesia panareensis TaxID=2527978 RepID=UPI0011AA38FD|nr:sigma-70 family RNA polymerase sigma factor [Gimesia panareensis]
MPFPETRHTLIQRIATTGNEDDWRTFMTDYWRPVCRFSIRWGKINLTDAEEVAALTFAALIQNQLLARWLSNPSARLRTLICSVVRNVLSNQARVQTGRQNILEKLAHDPARPDWILDSQGASPEQLDLFYAAWVEELLQDCVETVMAEYYSTNRGDYFRVLYGKICEQMTAREIAEHLGLQTTTVENYFKHSRRQLADCLEKTLEARVRRYSDPRNFDSEFQQEWEDLGSYLTAQGGLEQAVHRSYATLDSLELRQREQQSVTDILNRLDQQGVRKPDPESEENRPLH